jgi:hypothetical protein
LEERLLAECDGWAARLCCAGFFSSGAHGAGYRVDDESVSKTAAAKRLVDRKPADQARRKNRIPR